MNDAKNENGLSEGDLQKLKAAGKLANVAMYQEFVNRIGSGEVLKPSELKSYHQLQKEILGPEKSNGVLRSVPDAAEYSSLSIRSIKWNVSRGNLKQNPDGTFDREEIDKFVKTKRPQAQKLTSLESADLRMKRAKAKKEEILTGVLQGKYYPRKQVNREWALRLAVMRQGYEILPDRLAPILEGKNRLEIKRKLEDEIKRLFDHYARYGKYCPEDPMD